MAATPLVEHLSWWMWPVARNSYGCVSGNPWSNDCFNCLRHFVMQIACPTILELKSLVEGLPFQSSGTEQVFPGSERHGPREDAGKHGEDHSNCLS